MLFIPSLSINFSVLRHLKCCTFHLNPVTATVHYISEEKLYSINTDKKQELIRQPCHISLRQQFMASNYQRKELHLRYLTKPWQHLGFWYYPKFALPLLHKKRIVCSFFDFGKNLYLFCFSKNWYFEFNFLAL